MTLSRVLVSSHRLRFCIAFPTTDVTSCLAAVCDLCYDAVFCLFHSVFALISLYFLLLFDVSLFPNSSLRLSKWKVLYQKLTLIQFICFIFSFSHLACEMVLVFGLNFSPLLAHLKILHQFPLFPFFFLLLYTPDQYQNQK